MWRPQRAKVFKSKSGTARIKRDSYSSGTTGWWTINKQVKERSGGRCEAMDGGKRCGAKSSEVHHIIPLSRGGTSTMSNLIDLCTSCHDKRHTHRRIANHKR
jgi:5-methylcytosine-specific restriction endonuclease McrA